MRLEDAERCLGKTVAVNANGGTVFVGKLVGICHQPSITIRCPEIADMRAEDVHLNIDAVDGWVVADKPPRHGGKPVSG